MATLYVTEYAAGGLAQVGGLVMQAPFEPPLVEQAFAFTTTTQSAAFNAQTTMVRIEADAICAITFGTNPTAIVPAGGLGSQRLVAGQSQFHLVKKGAAMKVAAVTTT